MFTNKYDLSPSIAVWLAADFYDHNEDINYISVTELLKSPRQLILRSRATEEGITDISSQVASAMGTGIHEHIHQAWLMHYKQAMLDLGYKEKDIRRIKINPEVVEENDIPVYMEQRVIKQIGNYWIGGKFDMIMNGQLEDYKTTGVYSYIKKSNTDKFRLQGSMYRWLNPDKITNDIMLIQYIFLNWEAAKVSAKPESNYPKFKIVADPIKLLSIEETERWVTDKLTLLDSLQDTPEPELPLCTKEELWQDDPSYAYYKNQAKMARATKVFPNYYEAHQRYLADGSVGVIQERPCTVRACLFCGVSSLCTQKDQYIAAGLLNIPTTLGFAG